jgi:hypothetical protein
MQDGRQEHSSPAITGRIESGPAAVPAPSGRACPGNAAIPVIIISTDTIANTRIIVQHFSRRQVITAEWDDCSQIRDAGTEATPAFAGKDNAHTDINNFLIITRIIYNYRDNFSPPDLSAAPAPDRNV